MRLKPRVDALERQLSPAPASRWVRVIQHAGQTLDEVYAAHEAVNGPIDGANVILRVIISKPFPAPEAA